MKQKQYAPLSVAEMAVSLYAAEEGHLKDVEINKIGDFESALLDYFKNQHSDLLNEINEKCDYNDDVKAKLEEAVTKFKSTQTW